MNGRFPGYDLKEATAMPEPVTYNPIPRSWQNFYLGHSKDDRHPKGGRTEFFGRRLRRRSRRSNTNGLEPTGVVGVITWVAIYDAYKKIKKESDTARAIHPFRDDRDTLEPGDVSPEALFVQSALLKLSNVYSNLEFSVPTGAHDEAAQAAVKQLQRVAGTKRQDGVVDPRPGTP